MPAWLPVMKVILPHLVQLASAVAPVFTPTRNTDKADTSVSKQINELQSAVKTNAESIKIIAEQLQRTVQALEEAAESNERAIKSVRLTAILSLVIALALLGIAAIVASTR